MIDIAKLMQDSQKQKVPHPSGFGFIEETDKEKAKERFSSLFKGIDAAKERLIDYISYPEFKYGFPGLDDKTGGGIFTPELILISAGIGSGKTTLLRSMILKWLEQGMDIAGMLLEESVEKTWLSILSMLSGLRLNPPKDEKVLPDSIRENRVKAVQMFSERGFGKLDLYDMADEDSESVTIQVAHQYVEAAFEAGYKVVIIDTMSKVAALTGSDNDAKLLQSFSASLYDLAQKYRGIVVMTTHINRAPKGTELTLSRIKGSDGPAESATTVIAMDSLGKEQLKLADNLYGADIQEDGRRGVDYRIVSVLKSREYGVSDGVILMKYDKQTRVMDEVGIVDADTMAILTFEEVVRKAAEAKKKDYKKMNNWEKSKEKMRLQSEYTAEAMVSKLTKAKQANKAGAGFDFDHTEVEVEQADVLLGGDDDE